MTAGAGRLLAIDPGSVRIGVALSDPLGLTAQPRQALERIGPRKDVTRIADLVEEHGVTTIVVGHPLLLSGGEGHAACAARELAERLGRRLPQVSVELWDERFTSAEAERVLLAGGARRSTRKLRVDSLAAVLILQSFLDARCGAAG